MKNSLVPATNSSRDIFNSDFLHMGPQVEPACCERRLQSVTQPSETCAESSTVARCTCALNYMTKQAMNSLLVQLEFRGYIERRTERPRGRVKNRPISRCALCLGATTTGTGSNRGIRRSTAPREPTIMQMPTPEEYRRNADLCVRPASHAEVSQLTSQLVSRVQLCERRKPREIKWLGD